MLALDGVDPRVVETRISEGELPHLTQLKREGAYGRLRSREPLISPVVWTTIATGKLPAQHGITNFTTSGSSDTGDGIVSSEQRRVKALWNIFSQAGRSVAAVGWWATWPAEEVRGQMVTDRLTYHFLTPEGLHGTSPGRDLTHPPELAERLAGDFRRPADVGYEELHRFARIDRSDLGRPFAFDDELGHLRWALASAWTHRDVGLRLWRSEQPELELVYVEAPDSVSHLFGHLHSQHGLAGELAEQQRRYGQTVEAVYREVDALVGHFIEEIDDRTTLVVLSDHGFDLGVLHDNPEHARDLRGVSSLSHAREGVLFLYGHRVRPGATVEGAGILDVAPTLLALADLPPGCDMPGRVLTDVLDLQRPPECTDSYEEEQEPVTRGAHRTADAATEEALTRHLSALGYLGSERDATVAGGEDRILATIHFDEGRYSEAARIYSVLLQADPDDPRLATGLAAALGEMGRENDALRHLDRAVALDPLSPVARYNRGLLHERRGDTERAARDYRQALRAAPGFGPARRALSRLTGEDRARPPANPAERRADRLAVEASDAAKRGAYGRAMELLDRAEETAPGYPLVHQYRSNVAYLMDDLETAASALERALRLEPANPLYRANLEQLRRRMTAAEEHAPEPIESTQTEETGDE